MPHYIYLISDHTHKHIHSGYCNDVNKMIGLYNEQNEMSLNYPPENYLNRLVYLEQVKVESSAIDRTLYYTHLPLAEKIKEIESVNPDWVELQPGINIEL